MYEYIFLYVVALIWIIFAVVQDLKTREVANWLTFSLIAIVLAYRAFWSIYAGDSRFFIFGALGILVFVALAYGFYYARIFAGGDAKLLMGLGGVLPYREFMDLAYLGGSYIFLLFLAGFAWTLIFSVYLIGKKGNRKKFKKSFGEEFGKNKKWIVLIMLAGVILEFFNYVYGFFWNGFVLGVFVLLSFVWVYAKALEKGCMIVLRSPKDLMEGDWLERDVEIGRGRNKKIIRKSVHGLSGKEIALLRKAGKSVLIKDGVPFTPAFLIALVFGILI